MIENLLLERSQQKNPQHTKLNPPPPPPAKTNIKLSNLQLPQFKRYEMQIWCKVVNISLDLQL